MIAYGKYQKHSPFQLLIGVQEVYYMLSTGSSLREAPSGYLANSSSDVSKLIMSSLYSLLYVATEVAA